MRGSEKVKKEIEREEWEEPVSGTAMPQHMLLMMHVARRYVVGWRVMADVYDFQKGISVRCDTFK